VVNSTFISNSASYGGGAIYGSDDSNIEVVNSTFTSNSASDDEGVISGGEHMNIAYSVFYENNSTYDIGNYGFSTLFSNYIKSDKIEKGFANSSNIEPKEGDILFNSEYKLDANSTLINLGYINKEIYFFMFNSFLKDKTDIECNERVVGTAIDLGPFEFGGIDGNSCDLDESERNVSNEQTSDFTTVSLDLGWSLRAVDMNVSDIPQDVSIVWTYSNGNWSAFSPNGEMTQKIEDNNFEMTTDILSSENGTWFLSERKFDLIVPKKQIDALQTPTPSNLSAENLGWNLLGTNRELPAEAISCQNGDVRLIWKFFQNEWILFLPEINPSLYDLMFNTILPNEGFWVLCE
jgi:predicted outer membrane repeat protein